MPAEAVFSWVPSITALESRNFSAVVVAGDQRLVGVVDDGSGVVPLAGQVYAA